MRKPLALKLFHQLLAVLNMAGAIWVAGLMFLIVVDVIGRAFGTPLFGVPEIVKISVVGLVWCMMPHTLKIGAHLRSTILMDLLPAPGKRAIEVLSCVLGIAMFALIVYSGWDKMIEAWQIGEFEGEEPMRVPTAPIRTMVFVGAALTSLQFLVMLVEHLRGRPFAEDVKSA